MRAPRQSSHPFILIVTASFSADFVRKHYELVRRSDSYSSTTHQKSTTAQHHFLRLEFVMHSRAKTVLLAALLAVSCSASLTFAALVPPGAPHASHRDVQHDIESPFTEGDLLCNLCEEHLAPAVWNAIHASEKDHDPTSTMEATLCTASSRKQTITYINRYFTSTSTSTCGTPVSWLASPRCKRCTIIIHTVLTSWRGW